MKYAFINGNILDGTKDMEVIRDKTVLVSGQKIEDIVDKDYDLSGYEIIDLKGQYLLPGLINMHVHLAGNGKPQKKRLWRLKRLYRWRIRMRQCSRYCLIRCKRI